MFALQIQPLLYNKLQASPAFSCVFCIQPSTPGPAGCWPHHVHWRTECLLQCCPWLRPPYRAALSAGQGRPPCLQLSPVAKHIRLEWENSWGPHSCSLCRQPGCKNGESKGSCTLPMTPIWTKQLRRWRCRGHISARISTGFPCDWVVSLLCNCDLFSCFLVFSSSVMIHLDISFFKKYWICWYILTSDVDRL